MNKNNIGETVFKNLERQPYYLKQLIIDNIDEMIHIERSHVGGSLFLSIGANYNKGYISEDLNIGIFDYEEYVSAYNKYINMLRRSYKINKLIS